MDKTDRLRDYGLAFLLYKQGLSVCGYELIRELFIFIKLILNSYLPKKVVFLHDSSFEFDGISFGNISMRSLQSKEQNVQSATKMDFLITHIPPEGILDEGRGSLPLLLEVYRSQPRFHIFGHAHSCGNQSKGGAFTEFYNVSQFNELRNKK